jgi:hypothetical protein
VTISQSDSRAQNVQRRISVRMGAEKTAAKNAEVKAFALMGAAKITAKTVAGPRFVSMGGAKIFARNAAEMTYVCMIGSSTCASFAMWNVNMTKRRVSASSVLMNANRSQSSVRMGTRKTDAMNAKNPLYATMASADISAKIVGGRLIVSMDVSGTIAGTAAGSPYVCINCRFRPATFAVRNVAIANSVVDVKSVE